MVVYATRTHVHPFTLFSTSLFFVEHDEKKNVMCFFVPLQPKFKNLSIYITILCV